MQMGHQRFDRPVIGKKGAVHFAPVPNEHPLHQIDGIRIAVYHPAYLIHMLQNDRQGLWLRCLRHAVPVVHKAHNDLDAGLCPLFQNGLQPCQPGGRDVAPTIGPQIDFQKSHGIRIGLQSVPGQSSLIGQVVPENAVESLIGILQKAGAFREVRRREAGHLAAMQNEQKQKNDENHRDQRKDREDDIKPPHNDTLLSRPYQYCIRREEVRPVVPVVERLPYADSPRIRSNAVAHSETEAGAVSSTQ